jgi:hypothetical protein
MSAPYCPLPLTDKRRAYIPADHTDVAETFKQHEPIRVSPIRDDYDLVQSQDWLEIGGFK